MKRYTLALLSYPLSLAAFFALAVVTRDVNADQIKANNNTALQSGGSWVSGTAPGSGDNAVWNSTVSTAADCTNSLGSAVTWKGIAITNPAAPVMINGNTTLTLNNGINLGSATRGLTLNCGTIAVASNQTWTVASGLALTTGSSTNAGSVNGGNNIVTLAGSGTWAISGTGDDNGLGVNATAGTVNLNKTSSSGVHAIGGPGLTASSGATAKITGTGGDQIYDGGTVTINGTFDLNGNSETINSLNGSGTVTTTLSGGTPTLTVGGQGGSGVFTGIIEAGASGSITLTAEATNSSQSVACITSGSSTSGPFINVNGGTLTLNGTSDNSFAEATVNSGGTLLLDKTSSSSVHAIGGGLTINSGGAAQIMGTGGDQIYNGTGLIVNGGTFDLNGNSESIASLSFTGGTLQNSSSTTATLSDAGTLAMSGNVTVNDANAATGTTVILQYSGTRSGSGSFVAGSLPPGATVVDNLSAQTVSVVNNGSSTFPQVIVPSLNTNELVVAATTPQQYGAHGDGITDDSTAFQSAMNAVAGAGGGVVYVPVGNYAFYANLTIPQGVTLHGNWADWTTGTGGLVGTTFKVYFGAGQSTGAPFILMNESTALKDVNIWYPNQNPNSITPYPFSIGIAGDLLVQNVALVNSYQGIMTTNGGDHHILQTVIGTPLSLGFTADNIYDVCHLEDIRFSPNAWAVSGLTNAPAAGGAYATWMRANGTGIKLLRIDGEAATAVYINGYNVGIDFEKSSFGSPGSSWYQGSISNCATGILAQEMSTAAGTPFTWFTIEGDVAISRTATDDDNALALSHCTIIGAKGTSVQFTGSSYATEVQFQNCSISNTLQLNDGVFNVVDSSLSGSTQCLMSASATRAAFTGCTFSPSRNIVNNGNAGNLIIDSRQSITNTMPLVSWTNVVNANRCLPAKTTLFVATAYGATGNGTTDDTAAINSALTAAGSNGGGIVYLPPGTYHLTNTLNVPGGVQLRGIFEGRHWFGSQSSILQPYGGQGTTNGPAAVALAANSGLVGVTISYENQTTNCIPFPPAIQGRGGNVYVVGVLCPNPYIYIDLDTYTCTNHFIDMADGYALFRGFIVGNGSSGALLNDGANWTYWLNNSPSKSDLGNMANNGVVAWFGRDYLLWNSLGNCTETMMNDFIDPTHNLVYLFSEGGHGPNATLINVQQDGSVQGYVLDSAATSTINVINASSCIFADTTDPSPIDTPANTWVIRGTTNFQGTVRFFNAATWGSPNQEILVNGGDVGLDLFYTGNGNPSSSQVNAGVLHLINFSSVNTQPPYTVTYGTNAGVAGKTNEFIGSYTYNGCAYSLANVGNSYAIWNDYALSSYTTLNLGPVVVGDIYPNGAYQFESSSALTFQAASVNGINTSGITVQLIGTNLAGANYVTNYTSANGLTIGGTSTLRTLSAPLFTNVVYKAVIQVTDVSGNSATNYEFFDTIVPAFTFEAEDFDYNSGNYINNPQTNAYANLAGTSGIDYTNNAPGSGSASYRPQGLETEGANDIPRLAYGTGLQDYDAGFATSGNWGNYTRSFPAGTYNIYMRSASINGPTSDSATMYQVTAGRGTSSQTTSLLGTFSCPNTGGWQTYAWVPLLNSSGGLVTFTGGSVATLRVTTVNGGNNINFYLLVATNLQVPLISRQITKPRPVLLLASMTPRDSKNSGLTIQWAGESTDSPAKIYFTPSLTSPLGWTPVTNQPVFSSGQWIVTIPAGTNSSGFYSAQ